jgi:hypothetical protein
MSRMRGDPGQDVGQPGLRIDAVHLGRHDEAVHGGGALTATVGKGLITPWFQQRKLSCDIRFIP